MQMHRFILDAPKGILCDHRNGDGLDNRRQNIRLANHLQNSWNSRTSSRNTTGYRGVSVTHSGKYKAQMVVKGEFIYLGTFLNKEDAALAYNKAAKKHHGEFARLNRI